MSNPTAKATGLHHDNGATERKTVSVLLADDNPLFLRLVTQFLKEQGAAEVAVVGVAHDGCEALAQAQLLQPQIVLLDLAMPCLPGLEVIPRLRAILPSVPIIILSKHKEEGYRQAALAAGADDYIAKGSLISDLLPAIRRLV